MHNKSLFLLVAVTILFALGLFMIQPATAQSNGGPLPNFDISHFAGSGNCSNCHSFLTDDGGNDVSFDGQWRATTMANAARDPFWQAKVDSEIIRNPTHQAEIEATCSRCHMPMAHEQATSDGTTIAMFGTGFLDAANPLHEAAMDGVSCSLCHQITDDNLGDPSTFNGQFPIDTSTTSPDRVEYGKYDPVLGGIMQSSVGFLPVQSAHITDAGLCGTCHVLHTTPVDGSGNPLAVSFPEQTTFLEWTQSDFGDGVGTDTTCQSCHMPDIDGTAQISTVPSSSPRREDFGQHTFIGGNTLTLEILRDHGDDVGVTASQAQFNSTIALTEAKLAQETAVLSIDSMDISSWLMGVDLDIATLTGHKLPSGIPLRRAWIHFKMVDENGQVLLESGLPLADGQITGNDAEANAATFEPHYDLIDDANEVQIYEAIMENSDGDVTYTLLRAVGYVKDNRLLPTGFDKAGAPTDTAVYGDALADADFIGGGDQIRYEVLLPTGTETVTITAELLYQPMAFPVITDLRQDSSTLIDRFGGYFDDADHTPDVIASVSQTVGIGPTAVDLHTTTATNQSQQTLIWIFAIAGIALITTFIIRQKLT